MGTERTYLDVIKGIIDKERDRAKKEEFKSDIYGFIFGASGILLFLVALHLGFNVCMEPSGDCKSKPQSFLFQPRK